MVDENNSLQLTCQPGPNVDSMVCLSSSSVDSPGPAELAKRLIQIGYQLAAGHSQPALPDNPSELQQMQYCMELIQWLEKASDDFRKRFKNLESINQEQNLQLMARAQESENDCLTGLSNRRAFERKLGQRSLSAHHSQCPLILVLFDIDHFKIINDTRGHQVGDAVLRGLSRVLRKHLTEDAVLARIGGEEFVLMLTGVSMDQAIEVVESMRQAVAETLFTYDGQRLAISVSCGLAQLGENDHGDFTLRRADMAMYAAKQAGRNRTFWHDGQNLNPAMGDFEAYDFSSPPKKVSNRTVDLNQFDNAKCELLEPAGPSLPGIRNTKANWCDSVMLFWFLRHRVTESQRTGEPLCVMVVEVDGADLLAKEHGIAAQHFMIRAETLHLDSNLRETDVVARTCQTRVLAVLPRTELQSAQALLDRLRNSMGRFVFPTMGELMDYSISLGITQSSANDNVHEIIRRAEKALAVAQSHGPANFFACGPEGVWRLSSGIIRSQ